MIETIFIINLQDQFKFEKELTMDLLLAFNNRFEIEVWLG